MSDKRIVYINGTAVEVSEEIYTYLKRSEWNSDYAQIKRKREKIEVDQNEQTVKITPSKEDSLDRLMELGIEFPDNSEPFEDSVIRKISLNQALAQLTADGNPDPRNPVYYHAYTYTLDENNPPDSYDPEKSYTQEQLLQFIESLPEPTVTVSQGSLPDKNAVTVFHKIYARNRLNQAFHGHNIFFVAIRCETLTKKIFSFEKKIRPKTTLGRNWVQRHAAVRL